MSEAANEPVVQPQNGIKGLRHWRYDMLAGLQVAMVSLPLSLAIAIASGAPPVAGLISAIIAGLIFPLLGGAYVTISGPAAGLAPALLAGMLTLGSGDLAAGYPLLLVAICLTGIVQVILSALKAGKYAIFLPATVVEGMLAAIGVMIIIKQIPLLIGVKAAPTKSILAALANLPGYFLRLDAKVFLLGAICLFFMFFFNRSKSRWLKRLPAPVLVAGTGIALGYLFQLAPNQLIKVPDQILQGVTLPNFSGVWERQELWWSVIVIVITLTLIDGIESLATIAAVDKIDPFQRKSNPNVTLRAMGVSNMLSSLAGGLTIIPGGVKSRANIDAGGRTLWANAYNAVFLLVFTLLGTALINRIPLAALAAIIIYVGWRLCQPGVFSKTYGIGKDQFVIFVGTITAILVTDLLMGILLGVLAEFLLLLYLLMPSFRYVLRGHLTFGRSFEFLRAHLSGLLKSPVIKVKTIEQAGKETCEVSLSSVVCFNLLHLDKVLALLPRHADVALVVTESGKIIDHTAMEYLHHFREECLREGRSCTIQGMENYYPFSQHSLSARMPDVQLMRQEETLSERQKQMSEIAGHYDLAFSPGIETTLNAQNFVYFRRGDNKQKRNVMSGLYKGRQVKLFDYSHTRAPDYYSEHRHTLIIVGPLEKAIPDFIVAPAHYLERYLVGYREVAVDDRQDFSQIYRVYTKNDADIRGCLTDELIQFFMDHPKFYMEVRGAMCLAFRPDKELEQASTIPVLFSFADVCNKTRAQAGAV